MKEVETKVDLGLIEKVFSAVMESNTVEKINKLERLLAKNSDFVEALNQTYPDVSKPLNILHNLAVIDHCSAILPYLTKYIDSSLFKQQSHEGKTPIMSAIVKAFEFAYVVILLSPTICRISSSRLA